VIKQPRLPSSWSLQARRDPRRAPGVRPRVAELSIVLPIFNEAATVVEVIDRVLAFDLPGIHKQLIIVESNSTDGTRALVLPFAGDPRVQLILQDLPKGKGHAVRAGLQAATGDVILIQDGDLEYRVEDYPALLKPLQDATADFVLGSRHVKGQAMRQFQRSHVSRLLNTAHWIFATLFNVVYGTRLRDPFTMYKVFRRPCIDGLSFVSDRFDFDWELVAKLVRRGYKPVEVPVSYESRDFASGKKVRLFRDPMTWLWALVRFRVTRVPPAVPWTTVGEIGLDTDAAVADSRT
jgi:glycosyltransferase involved in cell wall biosynthesis